MQKKKNIRPIEVLSWTARIVIVAFALFALMDKLLVDKPKPVETTLCDWFQANRPGVACEEEDDLMQIFLNPQNQVLLERDLLNLRGGQYGH
jgi:hypothetical protein